MSGYNILKAELPCPGCGVRVAVDVEFRFGLLEHRTYALGERINWGTRGERYPRLRPVGGDYVGEGYAECESCHRDFWVSIAVRNDIFSSVNIDHSRKGYLPE